MSGSHCHGNGAVERALEWSGAGWDWGRTGLVPLILASGPEWRSHVPYPDTFPEGEELNNFTTYVQDTELHFLTAGF